MISISSEHAFRKYVNLCSYVGRRSLINFEIVKNLTTRCEGLSPALFFFAIFGNITYSMSICAISLEAPYILKNAGWLAGKPYHTIITTIYLCFITGSALTVFLDVFVSMFSASSGRCLTPLVPPLSLFASSLEPRFSVNSFTTARQTTKFTR